MVSSLIILALASAAAALQVTSPSKSSVWTVGESQTITWDSVSTDEDTFSIYLSNQVEYPSISTLLVSDVDSSAGSATIDGSKLSAGDSFTINFTNGDKTEQIYAQSNQFNITEGSSSSSSSSASVSSTSASSASSGTATTLATVTSSSSVTTGGASSATASSGSSAGANTHSSNGTATGSSTATATSASGSSTASGSSSASGTASGTSANASSTSSTSTSGAGNIVAGWMGAIAVAAMVL